MPILYGSLNHELLISFSKTNKEEETKSLFSESVRHEILFSFTNT